MMEKARNSKQEMEKDVEMFSKEKPDEETIVENANLKIDLPKKTRKATKQNPKPKVTVPQPFSLATEQRRMRDQRRGSSMDFKEPKPLLSKSPSLMNHKTGSPSNKTSLKPKVRINEKVDTPIEHVGDKMKHIPKENPTFKALPLPNFYRQKNPPWKSETKKMVVTRSKSLVLGDQVKTLSKSNSNKIEGNASRVTRGGAKETISKVLIKTAKNSLRAIEKETVKKLV
ncbi:protein WVD2-like 4 isoform X2 [Cynara cardunculus var. scolymus]|uniref:protein WVD2-like 4 isoform X2 n=1 Tax=Cynara cardunculus var. scolymus TaxID=59895 RepID=UPI000D626396|nr:protein WVD2-like 4 isoform X2 [Cynara cardunculus var. scolymus]